MPHVLRLSALIGLVALIQSIGGQTVLRTGGGNLLTQTVLPLDIPPSYQSASVRFEISFETDEQLIPGEFVDSFSLFFQNPGRTMAAAVLAVDRFGVLWTPASPGASTLLDSDVLRASPTNSILGSNHLFQASYLVLAELPTSWLNDSPELLLTLIDNLDPDASRAVISNVAIEPGIRSQLAVKSSAAVEGGYAKEDGIVVDRLRRTVTLPKVGTSRFFRLNSETNSQLTRLERPGADTVIHYNADLSPLAFELLGSDQPDGPFIPVSNAQFDLGARTASVPLLNAPAFFRITGNHPARIISDEVTGEFRVLEFEVQPNPPRVESSAQLSGPYARESFVEADPFARTLTLRGGGAARFYEIRGATAYTVSRLEPSGPDIILHYEIAQP